MWMVVVGDVRSGDGMVGGWWGMYGEWGWGGYLSKGKILGGGCVLRVIGGGGVRGFVEVRFVRGGGLIEWGWKWVGGGGVV